MRSTDFNSIFGSERKWFSFYPVDYLVSWGFTNRQATIIQSYAHIHIEPKAPVWLANSPKYKASPHKAPILEHTGSSIAGTSWLDGIEPTINDEPENDILSIVEDIYSGESTHDLQVKYQETFCKLGDSPAYIAFIDADTHTTSSIAYRLIKNGKPQITQYTSNINIFDLTLPKLGFINIDDIVLLLERKHKKSSPTRYRKSFRADGVHVINMSSQSLKILKREDKDKYNVGYVGSHKVIEQMAKELFFPKFYSYEEALSSVLGFERLSCAINSSLAIVTCFATNKIYLYKYQWNIGTFNHKEGLFEVNIDIYNDDLTKIGIPFKNET